MPSSTAKTAQQYLAELPSERRAAITTVRKVILDSLPPGFEEGIQYGMLGYYVPLSRLPDTYNGQALGVVALGSHKTHMSLYLMGVYADRELERWFKAAVAKAGKKLDMGKSCVRFRSVDDLPLEVVAQAVSRLGVDEFIATYESNKGTSRQRTTSVKKKAAKKKATKKKVQRRR